VNAVVTNPLRALVGVWRHRQLVVELTRRDVVGRYRGSVMGIAWSFINPLLMLAAYTFVFSAIFQARWPERSLGHSKVEFALILFAGLIVHSVMADCLNRAPMVITSNANYVKKVVFPIEVLPVVTLLSALFHAAVSTVVLVLALLLVIGSVPATAIVFPVVLLPFALGVAGFAWLLASLGVFLRDVGQSVGVVVMLLMFLAPIFFPLAAVPAEFKVVVMLNPLTWFVQASRDVLLWGQWPDPVAWLVAAAIGLLVALFGLWWFQKTRKGFADVL
jgi:lipopolysaccharide transport system permease protein